MKRIAILIFMMICICACKKQEGHFSGNTYIIKKFEKELSLPLTKVNLEDIYDGAMLANDSLILFTSDSYNDYWMYVFSLKSEKHITSLCPKGEGPNDFFSCKNSGQLFEENGQLKLWVRDNQKGMKLLNITHSIAKGITICDSVMPINWNKNFLYPATSMFALKNKTILAQNQCEEQYATSENYVPRKFYLFRDPSMKDIKEYKLFNRPVVLQNRKYDPPCGTYYTNKSCLKPDESKVAMAMRLVAQISILDLKSGKQNGFVIDNTNSYSDIERNYESIRYYYMYIAGNDKFIFAPYIDCSPKENAQPYFSNTIHVFDWQGRPKYKVNIEKKISSIALDAKNKILYMQDCEGKLWACNVSMLN